MIIHIIIVKRIGFGQIYDNIYVLKQILIMTLVTVGITAAYQYNIIRYIIILCYGIVFIRQMLKNKSAILRLLKDKKIEA